MSWEIWEFPGYKVVCSTVFSVFLVYVVVDLILRLLIDLVFRYIVGGAFNGDYMCLLYPSLPVGLIIGAFNI